MEKVYLAVNVFVSPEGITTPTSIVNEHGRVYPIKVKTRKRQDDYTMRYTVLVSGREMNLYNDLVTNKWYALRSANS